MIVHSSHHLAMYASRACAQYKCTLHAHVYTRASVGSRIEYSVINNNSRVRKWRESLRSELCGGREIELLPICYVRRPSPSSRRVRIYTALILLPLVLTTPYLLRVVAVLPSLFLLYTYNIVHMRIRVYDDFTGYQMGWAAIAWGETIYIIGGGLGFTTGSNVATFFRYVCGRKQRDAARHIKVNSTASAERKESKFPRIINWK